MNIYFHIKTEDPINWFDWHDFLSCVDVFPIETGGLGTTYFIFNYVTSMSNHSLFGYSTTGGGEFSFHTTSDWKTIWAAQKRSSIFLAHFPRSERLFYISREQKKQPLSKLHTGTKTKISPHHIGHTILAAKRQESRWPCCTQQLLWPIPPTFDMRRPCWYMTGRMTPMKWILILHKNHQEQVLHSCEGQVTLIWLNPNKRRAWQVPACLMSLRIHCGSAKEGCVVAERIQQRRKSRC